jgi:hypothetical protein
MRWSQAEAKAVQERMAGEPYNRDDYKDAMRAAQYNQKNGWSDDGSKRTSSGTPLRNNQKREGNPSDPPEDGGCVDSFMIATTACDEGGGDIAGDGGDPEDGGLGFEDLGYSMGSLGVHPATPPRLDLVSWMATGSGRA